MVEPRSADKMPDPSPAFERMTVDGVLDLTVGSADSDPKREALLWKSVAAENVENADERPELPESLADVPEEDVEAVRLERAGGKSELLRLLEHAVYPRI